MRLLKTAARHSMSCSGSDGTPTSSHHFRHTAKMVGLACLVTLSACAPEPKRIVAALKPPPERLECQNAGTRPTIPPEHIIDWTRVVTAGDARAQHEAFVTKLREREGLITGYLVKIEGALFVCSSNALWLKDFFAGLPD